MSLYQLMSQAGDVIRAGGMAVMRSKGNKH